MTKGQPAWVEIIKHLKMMLEMIDKDPEDPIKIRDIAPVYVELSNAYNEAIKQSGLSSMRVRAVVKALDLKTDKSKLKSFLGNLMSSSKKLVRAKFRSSVFKRDKYRCKMCDYTPNLDLVLRKAEKLQNTHILDIKERTDARELIDAAKERDRIKHLMFDSMPGRTIIELKADNDNLRALLRKFEWAGFNGFDEENCWICKATKFVLDKNGKHAPDCKLAAVLERS